MKEGFFRDARFLLGVECPLLVLLAGAVVRLVAFVDCFCRTAVKQEGRALTPDFIYSGLVPFSHSTRMLQVGARQPLLSALCFSNLS